MPRSKGELGAKAMHIRYKALYPNGVAASVYVQLVEDFNKRVAKLVLGGSIIKLPFQLGDLQVEKRKLSYDHLKVDFGHWRKTGEKVFHTNRHSDGYHAYFYWKKVVSNFTHKSLYKFCPCRSNSRQLATIMKVEGGHKIYSAYVRTKEAHA